MLPTDRLRNVNQSRFDALSIPNYVIRKGPSRGARHGNTEVQQAYFQAHGA